MKVLLVTVNYFLSSVICLLLSVLCLLSSASGLELKVHNAALDLGVLQSGHTYETGSMVSSPIRLANPGKENVLVAVRAVLPASDDVFMRKAGCKPMPDLTWVKLAGDKIVVPAGGSVVVNAELNVPKNRKYRKKRYQFNIEFQSMTHAFIEAGVASVVRFEVGK